MIQLDLAMKVVEELTDGLIILFTIQDVMYVIHDFALFIGNSNIFTISPYLIQKL